MRKVFTFTAALVLVATIVRAQDFPPHAQVIVETLYGQHLDLANGSDDERRALTRLIIEQIVFEMGSSWGGKSADPTRPFSKDSIAHIGPGGALYGCDWQEGSTRRPFRPVECQNISGQNFIPVAGKNHLGSAPVPPGTGEPDPLPTIPSVNLVAVLDRLNVIMAAQGQQTAQAERIFTNVNEQLANLRADVAAVQTKLIQHDEEPGWLKRLVSNRYAQMLGAAVLGKYGIDLLK